jgi:hypothetical protein
MSGVARSIELGEEVCDTAVPMMRLAILNSSNHQAGKRIIAAASGSHKLVVNVR